MSGGAVVAVTGLGLISPLGVGVAATWKRLCSGISTATRDEKLTGLPVDFSCAVPGYDAGELLGRRLAWRLDPFTQMALVAAREAVADAGHDPTSWDGTRVAVVIGVASSGMDGWPDAVRCMDAGTWGKMSPLHVPRCLPNMAAGEVCLDMAATGPSFTVSSACASGATAIGLGRDLLRSGACDIALVGGAESGRNRLTCAAFHRLGALSTRTEEPVAASRPFDTNRDGFVLGEGAGILVMERETDAVARGARTLGLLRGYGASADAHHVVAPAPEGVGLERAVRVALTDAGMAPDEIGHVNAHGTATPAGDLAEASMISRVLPHRPPVTATKSLTGHALGAAGALEAGYTLLSLHYRSVPPVANLDDVDPAAHELDLARDVPAPLSVPTALSNSSGFGGQNAALVFTAV